MGARADFPVNTVSVINDRRIHERQSRQLYRPRGTTSVLRRRLILAVVSCALACSNEPTAPAVPNAPTSVAAAAHKSRVTVSWTPANGADRYNLYWATTSGVTKATGARLSGVTSPFEHTGLTNSTTYFYVVTAENAGGESRESAQASATPVNSAPAAAAGADQTAATGATVTLDGSGSADPDGDALTFAWTQVSGTTVTLVGPTTAHPTFAAPRHLGVLQFSLIVSDGQATSQPGTVSIAVDRFSQFAVATGVAPGNSDTETPGKLAAMMVGQNVLLVSCRLVGSPLGLFGTIVDTAGHVLQSFPIASHNCDFPRPSVASDGTGFLVVFHRGDGIFATRLSGAPGYSVLSEATVSTGTSNFAPVVAFGATGYFVVWEKFGSSGYDIYGARVGTDGQPSAEIPVFVATGEQVEPAIAFDGANYLVIWRDTRTGSGPSSDTDIFGTRVAPDGTVLDATGIAISTAPNPQGEPALTFDGTNYFAVWSDARRYPAQTQPAADVFGTRISPAGTLLDGTSDAGGIAISTAAVTPNVTAYPSAVFDGTHIFVIFSVVGFSPPAGIYYARVATNGTLLDQPPDQLRPSISGPPPSYSRPVYPVIVSNGLRSVLAWVNNTELSGAAKDVVGVTMDPF